MLNAGVIVVGGNPGGCSAAIAAARSGHTVILLEPTATLGGINANGTCGFDSATTQALSGIAKEVETWISDYYRRFGVRDPLLERRSDQVWEPHVAAKAWHAIVGAEAGITVQCGAVAVGVTVEDDAITSVLWHPATDPMGNIDPLAHDPEVACGAMVIDATYEGDIAAWAGVPFRLGREARSHEEPHAGIIYTNHLDTSPTGIMPQSILPGSTGDADPAIMAFSFRIICRLYNDPGPRARHRLQAPPPGYDSSRYAWAPSGRAPDGSPTYFNSLYDVVNDKLLLNRLVHGNNLAAPARDYVLADPIRRKALRQQFIDHSLGYLFFIQNDGGMPQLGLAEDEFVGNQNFPHQLYVREGRRIEALTMLTEASINPYITGDGTRPPLRRDSIAVADWMIESQGCRDEIEPDQLLPEGFLFVRAAYAPFQVPYGCLLPPNVTNLLVPGAIGATHISFSAFRCEAGRIQTGIASGIAASFALRRGCAPRDVPVSTIQDEIIARGGQLTYFSDVPGIHAQFAAIQWAALQGFVPQDRSRAFRPDHPATWSDLARAVVTCLGLPISVTGAHFDSIGQDHPDFRYFESLYDLGTRTGVDAFDMRSVRTEDPMVDFIRVDRGAKRIPVRPDSTPSSAAVDRLLEAVATAHGVRLAPAQNADVLSRGEMVSRVLALHQAIGTG